MTKENRVEMINLTPTMHCNLKCKLCGVLVPQYEYRPEMNLGEFDRTLNAVFQVIDHVKKLQITGGEPLMYQKLPDLIKKCFAYSEKFDEVWIFTNGSIPIKQELLEVIREHHDKMLIHISDYGVRQEVTLKLVENIKQTGCRYRYLKYYGDNQYFDGWVDQGDFVPHGRKEGELKDIFDKCPHVCRGGSWYVRNGQMHWCGRSIRGMELNKIPVKNEEYLNIFEGSVEERREHFRKMRHVSYITACDYCNGNYGTDENQKRYPAGEQM